MRQSDNLSWLRQLTVAGVIAVLLAGGIYSEEIGVSAGFAYAKLFGDQDVILNGTKYPKPADTAVIVRADKRVTLGVFRSFGDVGLVHILARPHEDPVALLRQPAREGKIVGSITPVAAGRLYQECFQAEYQAAPSGTDHALYCPSSGLLFSVAAADAWLWPRVPDMMAAMSVN